MKFKLFNIAFEIDYIFLCMIVSYSFLDVTGLFLPLLLSVLLHETAHILFLIFFNSKITSVKLKIGAVIVEFKDDISKYKKIVSIIAGPLSNLMLSVVAYLFKNNVFFAVNLVVAIYNFLPIKGLDGGSILETLCDGFFSEKTIRNVLSIATIFVIACMVWFYIKNIAYFNNYSMLLLCLYVITPLLLKKVLKDG